MAAALWRRRRLPIQLTRSRAAALRDRRRVPPPPVRRRDVAAVAVIPAGPGSLEPLLDTIDSVVASDGDDIAIVVVDDCTADVREADVRERWPQADVVRQRVPSGGPPRLWPVVRLGLRHALGRYDAGLIIKLDTDALAVGPGLAAVTASRMASGAERPGLGGSLRVRADGAPEDHVYHAGVLSREARRDPVVAAALHRAEAAGWRRGDAVQAGVCALTRDGLTALERDGWLGWNPAWHSQIPEDLALALFVSAAGFDLVSLGDPHGIYAVANKSLPLDLEELAGGPWVAAHSVRAGLGGEPEDEVRAFFRARRSGWRRCRPAAASG